MIQVSLLFRHFSREVNVQRALEKTGAPQWCSRKFVHFRNRLFLYRKNWVHWVSCIYLFCVVWKLLIHSMSTSIYFLYYKICFILSFLRQELVLMLQRKRFVMLSIEWLMVMQKMLPALRWIQTKCRFSRFSFFGSETRLLGQIKPAHVYFLSRKYNERTEACWYWKIL